MDAVQSRINEVTGVVCAAKRKISQCWSEVLEKFNSAEYQYFSAKFHKVAGSGRNTKYIKCEIADDGKSAFLGRKYFPGLLIYSTTANCVNANNKVKVNNKKLKCGMLSKLYAEGHIPWGKKGYAECGSIAQLENRLQELAQSNPSFKFECAIRLIGKCTETHCFQLDEFSLVLNRLVQKYRDMPCGDSKVFLLRGGPFSNEPGHVGHSMVLRLEKKTPGILIIRHWDPNWTFLDQKVILGHPDCAQFLKLSDLYTPEDEQLFFSNGVGSLTLFEGESEEFDENLYWHVRTGDRGHCVFEFKNGIWRKPPEEDTPMADGFDYADTMSILENCIWAIFADETKSESQKHAFLTHLFDYTNLTGLIRRLPYPFWKALGVSWMYLQAIMPSDQDLDVQVWGKEYRLFYDYMLEVSKEPDSEYLARSLQVTVSFNDWHRSKDIIRSVLMDSSKSCEEKKLILQGGNGWFSEAVMKGKSPDAVLTYVHEVLQSDLPESIKVDLLEAKNKLGKPVFCEMLKCFDLVDLAYEYALNILKSNMDIQSKRKILSVDQSLQMIEMLEESSGGTYDTNSFDSDKLQNIKESMNELKNEPNGF
ncbi:hypothetical protein [Endozoicomonas sp. ONNA2]|uniref:hypothetical protein n=1 Tax=Endozoicomonas sp. ONNA2 TaxID=2828741 RepID=UPI0021485E3F|nr:hypothetical protein [Endozoicomonas sp. ONNA2]